MTGWQNSTRAARLPGNWQTIRKRILARDGFQCQLRGEHCTHTATEVDHITAGDNHNPANLQSVCAPCHADKTKSEHVAATKATAARRLRPTEPHPGMIEPPRGPMGGG